MPPHDAAVHVHCPPLHVWPAAQRAPHAPQLLGSVCKLAQVPLQLVCPDGQHVPLEQICPLEHTLPQRPQLAVVVSVTHVFEQQL